MAIFGAIFLDRKKLYDSTWIGKKKNQDYSNRVLEIDDVRLR